MKKLIVFDLDGTLAESKSPLDPEMAALLNLLLGIVRVSVISGGDWSQLEKQVLSNLTYDTSLKNLSLLTTCGTKFYTNDGGWKLLYSEDFTKVKKNKILTSLEQTVSASADCKVPRVWGETIQDRGSQIIFSALGQQAPLEEKALWDPNFAKRKKIKAILDQELPEFSLRLGGAISIDITKQGIDKGYGIRKLQEVLGIAILDMLFVGDVVFPSGNDYCLP